MTIDINKTVLNSTTFVKSFAALPVGKSEPLHKTNKYVVFIKTQKKAILLPRQKWNRKFI